MTGSDTPNSTMATWISLATASRFNSSIVFDSKNNSLYAIVQHHGLLQYSFDNNLWTCKLATSFPYDISYRPVAIDCEQRKIYLNHKPGSIAMFTIGNDNQTKLEMIDNVVHIETGYGSTGIMIRDEFHIIGGDGDKHLKYYPSTQKAEVLHKVSSILDAGCCYHLRSVKIGDKVLLFGGNNFDDQDWRMIHQYNIIENAWSKIDCQLPVPLNGFGCTAVLNGQFVVLFGGESHDTAQDDIYIYSTRDQIFTKSNIKCPAKADYQAFAICDRKRDELSTFGFMRDEWRKCE